MTTLMWRKILPLSLSFLLFKNSFSLFGCLHMDWVFVDLVYEHTRMGVSTCLEAMYKFCKAVVAVFCPEFGRTKCRQHSSSHGYWRLKGIFRDICEHWLHALGVEELSIFLVGEYNRHPECYTIILEAVVSQDLFIWHPFFNMVGSYNDCNVLQHSLVFLRLVKGQNPECNYEINYHHYTKG
jgi:hypothetical protein